MEFGAWPRPEDTTRGQRQANMLADGGLAELFMRSPRFEGTRLQRPLRSGLEQCPTRPSQAGARQIQIRGQQRTRRPAQPRLRMAGRRSGLRSASLGRPPDGRYGRRSRQQIKPLRIPHDVEILDFLPVNLPLALPVAKAGIEHTGQSNTGYSRICCSNLPRITSHSAQAFKSSSAVNGGSAWAISRNPRSVGLKSNSWPSTSESTNMAPAAGTKNVHQSFRACSSPFGWNGRTSKPCFCKARAAACTASLVSVGSRYQAVILEVADSLPFHLGERYLTLWDGRAHRIDGVLPGEHLEQQRNIIHGTGHRSNGPQNRERSHAGRQVTASWDSARRWLQRADTGEVSRYADRSSTITAQAAA